MTASTVGFKTYLVSFLAVSLFSCTTIAPYNEKAYENATSMKAESLNVISNGTDDYNDHSSEIKALKLDMSKAAEFANGLKNNVIVTKMYAMFMNEDNKGSLYGVLEKWREKKNLDRAYVKEMERKIGQQFDQLIDLEQGKFKN